jgi:hypothetical protein
MSVDAAIRTAEGLLPGEPAPDGATDPRWQAIIAVAEFIPGYPEEVWQFARRWSAHEQEDVRVAIATCVLEHLLEHHFDVLFDRVEAVAREDALFMDTLSQCSKFGLSLERRNSKRLDRLIKGARRAS